MNRSQYNLNAVKLEFSVHVMTEKQQVSSQDAIEKARIRDSCF